jgi:DNA-binding GntR family transcriptional regulator
MGGKPLPTYSEFARKDAEFHATIAEASGNAFLADALAKLRTHVHIFRLVFHTRVTTEAIGEHTELLAALQRGDAAGSKRSMREHILASRSRVLTLLPQ